VGQIPLTAAEIATIAIGGGLLQTEGKTPQVAIEVALNSRRRAVATGIVPQFRAVAGSARVRQLANEYLTAPANRFGLRPIVKSLPDLVPMLANARGMVVARPHSQRMTIDAKAATSAWTARFAAV
jgi:hypothetical protein